MRKVVPPRLTLVFVDDPKGEERMAEVYRFLIEKAYANLLRKHGLDRGVTTDYSATRETHKNEKQR